MGISHSVLEETNAAATALRTTWAFAVSHDDSSRGEVHTFKRGHHALLLQRRMGESHYGTQHAMFLASWSTTLVPIQTSKLMS